MLRRKIEDTLTQWKNASGQHKMPDARTIPSSQHHRHHHQHIRLILPLGKFLHDCGLTHTSGALDQQSRPAVLFLFPLQQPAVYLTFEYSKFFHISCNFDAISWRKFTNNSRISQIILPFYSKISHFILVIYPKPSYFPQRGHVKNPSFTL